jgi:hypothetical protein
VRRDRTSKRLGSLSLGPIESGVGVRDAMVGGDVSTGRWKEYCSRCSRWVANVRAARGWSVVGHDVPEDGDGEGDERLGKRQSATRVTCNGGQNATTAFTKQSFCRAFN